MRVRLYDTTLRDGSQGEGVNFSLADKLALTAKLDALGIDFVEGGYPLSNPKDAAYFAEVRSLKLTHAKVAAFGMTRRRGVSANDDKGMQSLLDARTEVVTIVGKTWDLHVSEVLRVDLDENLAMIADTVRFLTAEGRTVFYDAEHFFDGLRHNRLYALKTIETAAKAGAAVVILCDTNGGSLPDWVAEATDLAKSAVGVPLGFHGHNDGDLATANTLAAVAHGVTQVQGTINGIGERCGNTDLICVVPNLMVKLKKEVLPDPAKLGLLTEISRYVYDLAAMNFRTNQPFVGQSAFAHKGGMHVHAVERIPHTYEHLEPSLVGNERRILMSELAGQSNVLALHGTKHSLSREQAVRVLQRVQELENAGYQFEAADGSLDLLVRREAGTLPTFWHDHHYRVGVAANGAAPTTEATVKLRVGDRWEHTVAEGDGPVNALDGALRKALEPAFPALRTMRLVDFKVRVVNPRAGTAAKVRVTITSQDDHDAWGTVGVHENIIEASWRALVESFEYKLAKAGAAPPLASRARQAEGESPGKPGAI